MEDINYWPLFTGLKAKRPRDVPVWNRNGM